MHPINRHLLDDSILADDDKKLRPPVDQFVGFILAQPKFIIDFYIFRIIFFCQKFLFVKITLTMGFYGGVHIFDMI